MRRGQRERGSIADPHGQTNSLLMHCRELDMNEKGSERWMREKRPRSERLEPDLKIKADRLSVYS